MSTISVIVPVYKVENYIHRCVRTILEQTYADFELILVDDGSPDNCGAICDEYAATDKRVVVIHQKNEGLSSARNAGINWVLNNSDSQWITFIDSDDWVHPQYLASLLSAAIQNNVSISICNYIEVTGNIPIISHQSKVTLWTAEDFFVERNTNAVVAWGKLYQRDCFSKVRFPNGKIHEDESTIYQVLFSKNELAIISVPLYFYYMNENGIMKSEWTPMRLNLLEAFEEQIMYFQKNGYKKAYQHQVGIYIRKINRWLNESKKAGTNHSLFACRGILIAKKNAMLRTHYRAYMSDTRMRTLHNLKQFLHNVLGHKTYNKLKTAIKNMR